MLSARLGRYSVGATLKVTAHTTAVTAHAPSRKAKGEGGQCLVRTHSRSASLSRSRGRGLGFAARCRTRETLQSTARHALPLSWRALATCAEKAERPGWRVVRTRSWAPRAARRQTRRPAGRLRSQT
eukprot:4697320-Prymnesium_polylepis.1